MYRKKTNIFNFNYMSHFEGVVDINHSPFNLLIGNVKHSRFLFKK